MARQVYIIEIYGLGKNPAPFLGIENQRDVYIDI